MQAMTLLVAITGIGYSVLVLFMVGAMRINPPDPIDPPTTAQ